MIDFPIFIKEIFYVKTGYIIKAFKNIIFVGKFGLIIILGCKNSSLYFYISF